MLGTVCFKSIVTNIFNCDQFYLHIFVWHSVQYILAINSFKDYVLITHYMSATVFKSRETIINQIDRACPHEFH